MTQPILKKYQKWYLERSLREKLFVILLGWVLSLALLHFLILTPLNNKKKSLKKEIITLKSNIKEWEMKITAIKKIAESPLYKKWLDQNQASINIRKQYAAILHDFSLSQWKEIITTTLQSQNNIRIIQIKNFSESIYTPIKLLGQNMNVYEQKMQISMYSDFYDTLGYLNQIEKLVPNIQWNELKYTVVQYPIAKVEILFSIYYENQ